MWIPDQWKSVFQWRGDEPDPEPHYGLVFLVLLPLGVGIGAVAWLGWSWPALIVTVVVTLLVGGFALRRWMRNWRTERQQIPEWR
ncbi:MAG: hypothetical protein ACLFWH_11145 [Actinomycetota bacterium]